MIRFSRIRKLRQDNAGATLTEFAIVAPVLMVVVMGVFDVGHTQYSNALLNGALQKAGRDLTLQSASVNEDTIDAAVKKQIQNVLPGTADVKLTKLSHFEFEDIGEEEEYDDVNNDGTCNNNEVYVDYNGNGQWDAIRGFDGIGGARDAVLYTAIVKYDRLFPMAGLIGLSEQVEIQASTVLRNQPFDEQQILDAPEGNCS
ncbi:TadE/TadG family type IV pilus assembly protein [uncultured Erythrobacter sp.]|uniref:TadE/TadG family type IV pilus assembly protein n=1 Tax=uncultured Erythrobacter sp. TaxID=263913 RepID=UPI002617FCE8|nr:TadE/TadG family type IV pilus assembly protein [uncultured Erythrobacter sp.]